MDRTLSEVRLEPGTQRRAHLSVVAFIDEIAATGLLHAKYREIHFSVEPIDPALSIVADPQLLASAVINLLHNAFKNTPSGRRVVLRARAEQGGCSSRRKTNAAGFHRAKATCFRSSATDAVGIGRALAWDSGSLERQYERTGEIRIRNMPGTGCVLTIDVPLRAEDSVAQPVS